MSPVKIIKPESDSQKIVGNLTAPEIAKHRQQPENPYEKQSAPHKTSPDHTAQHRLRQETKMQQDCATPCGS